MSNGGNFFVGRLLLVMYMALAAECSNNTASSYYVMAESTLLYYDMSTEYITPTTASSATSLLSSAMLTTTPSPTSNVEPDIQEMESNAVVMTFNDIDLEQWMQIESTFLSIIADECTRQCAMSYIDCGTMNNVNYTSDDVVILPGYPRIVGGRLSIAFSVSLPSGAMLADGEDASVISQDTLFSIAAAATGAVTAQTGADVHEVGRYTAPATAESSESKSNLALILPLTLIPSIIIISVAAGLGSFYAWKLMKKHKSLDLNKSLQTEQVELMSYKATVTN